MTGHAQLKFVMTECSKTQIRLAGLIYLYVLVTSILKDLFCIYNPNIEMHKDLNLIRCSYENEHNQTIVVNYL